jgi:hypothetical protein
MRNLFQAIRERLQLKNRIKGLFKAFDQNARQTALELSAAFILAVASDGISKEELEELSEKFKAFQEALKD